MKGLWPIGEGALTYQQAAVAARAPFAVGPARPTKAAVPVVSAVIRCVTTSTTCKAVVAYFFWFVITSGYPTAASLWNQRIAPWLRKNTAPPGAPPGFEVKVPDMAPTWAELSDDAYELMRQLWGLVRDDPFPKELKRPSQIVPAPTPAPPTPAPTATGGGWALPLTLAAAVGVGVLVARR